MDITIVEQEENPMLHRTDVRFEVVHDEATPSRLSVRDSLAAQLDKASEEVVVHELDTRFGMRKTAGYAKVYESPGHARDVEQAYMLERNKISADGQAADAPDDGDGGGDEPAEAGVADEADEGEDAGEAGAEEPAAAEEDEDEAAEAEDEEPPADEDGDAAEADDAGEDEEAAAEEEA